MVQILSRHTATYFLALLAAISIPAEGQTAIDFALKDLDGKPRPPERFPG